MLHLSYFGTIFGLHYVAFTFGITIMGQKPFVKNSVTMMVLRQKSNVNTMSNPSKLVSVIQTSRYLGVLEAAMIIPWEEIA